jgi:hypothetical protein
MQRVLVVLILAVLFVPHTTAATGSLAPDEVLLWTVRGGKRELFRVNVSTRVQKLVTREAAQTVRLAPDRTKIAIVRPKRITFADSNGQRLAEASIPGYVTDLDWSPDGSKLVYLWHPSNAPSREREMRIVSGSDPASILTKVDGRAIGEYGTLTSVRWMYTGSILVLDVGEMGGSRLALVSKDGKRVETIPVERLLQSLAGVRIREIAKSPTDHIALIASYAGKDKDVQDRLVVLDPVERRIVFSVADHARHPAWSLDGRLSASVLTDHGAQGSDWDLWVFDSSGRKRNFTWGSGVANVERSVWLPWGTGVSLVGPKTIVFEARVGDTLNVYSMREVAGTFSRPRLVARNAVIAVVP